MKKTVLLLIISGCLFISSYKKDSHSGSFKLKAGMARENESLPDKGGNLVRLVHNEKPEGADLDVIDTDDNHLFRILLPEAVTAKNVPGRTFLNHTMPGIWGETDGVQWCRLRSDGWMEAIFGLLPREQGTLILFGIRNLSSQTLEGVAMDICVSVSHLPCPQGAWINPQFLRIPEPPDRDSAGCFWYEKVAPWHLKAFTDGRWVSAHRSPKEPSSKGVPRYEPWVYLDNTAYVMAAETLDGKERLFQAWDSPCKVRCAFPGNSCMHLEPILSDRLLPGQITFIRGEIALTDAPWKTISEWSAIRLQAEYNAMKVVLENP
jgi:hypothetical protein